MCKCNVAKSSVDEIGFEDAARLQDEMMVDSMVDLGCASVFVGHHPVRGALTVIHTCDGRAAVIG